MHYNTWQCDVEKP